MTTETSLLLGTAATLGFVHTLLGPDHYVPFVAMARARQWTMRRALAITLLSGIGHVTSSVVIGLAGLAFGVEMLKLTRLESLRGGIAGWLLLGFGLAYMIWGLRRAFREEAAQVVHEHQSLAEADHAHDSHEHGPHTHIHAEKANITPWVLFMILVFGPCEPLIPVIMYPAARADVQTMFLAAMTFSVVTIATMAGMVFLTLRGLRWIPLQTAGRYAHALAGLVVVLCGAGVTFFGL